MRYTVVERLPQPDQLSPLGRLKSRKRQRKARENTFKGQEKGSEMAVEGHGIKAVSYRCLLLSRQPRRRDQLRLRHLRRGPLPSPCPRVPSAPCGTQQRSSWGSVPSRDVPASRFVCTVAAARREDEEEGEKEKEEQKEKQRKKRNKRKKQ